MLKRFYRLKRQKGVVLFMVIAIMTLLIAMATTAYMTALSSYKTVVSNYDFSQMYLSAISSSDMIIEALTQETSHSDTNDYSVLKKKVKGLESNTLPDPIPAGYTYPSISGSTPNINGITDINAIIDAAGSAPAVNGALDALSFEVKLVKQGKEKIGGKETGVKINYFTLTTTAYYRGSYVTVQDMVIHRSGNEKFDKFNTFFTATGKTLDADPDTGRVVEMKTHTISDDTFFENPYTILRSGNGNNFEGGLQTSGNLYLYQFTSGMSSPKPKAVAKKDADGNTYYELGWDQRDDWFIGGDLVIRDSNAQPNLKGNNIYIKGDLILSGNNGAITADNIYVFGNVYALAGTNDINANLHVAGNIYNTTDSSVQAGASNDPGHMKELLDNTTAAGNPINITFNGTDTHTGNTLRINKYHSDYSIDPTTGEITLKTVDDSSGTPVLKKYTIDPATGAQTPAELAPGENVSQLANILHNNNASLTNVTVNGVLQSGTTTWDTNITVPSTSKLRADSSGKVISDDNGNKDATAITYVESGEDSGLEEVMSSKSKRQSYASYSAEDTTLSNVLDIDFDEFVEMTVGKEFKASTEWNKIDNGDGTFYVPIGGNNITDSSTTAVQLIYDVVTNPSTPWDAFDGATYVEIPISEFDPSKSPSDYIAAAEKRFEWIEGSPTYTLYTKKDDGTWDTATKNKTGDKTAVAEFTTTDGQKATVKFTDTGTPPSGLQINLPYAAEGYALGLYNLKNVNVKKITYNIGTKADIKDATTGEITTNNTMPIVLKANYDDGSTNKKDENGYNSFIWGRNPTYNDNPTDVQLVDSGSDGQAKPDTQTSAIGNVIFEVGNYKQKLNAAGEPEYKKKADGTFELDSEGNKIPVMEYTKFVDSNHGNIYTATYYETPKLAVGTYNQVKKISDNGWYQNDGSIANEFLQSGTSYPKTTPDYQNRVIFVSNKNGSIAINGTAIDHTLCGYFYAPNGTYYSMGRGGGDCPIFGGMIVSVYQADLDQWVYCSPDPQMIDKMFEKLGNNSNDSAVDEWEMKEGKNYMG